jgi:hypothetical protein
MRAHILRSASMSCAEAPSPSRLTSNTLEAVCSTFGTLAPAPVPAEGWAVEAEGLAGSGAGGGVVAWAVVASAPAKRVLDIRSWILPRGGCQTVGGNQTRRWTPTQQPPDDSALLRRGHDRRSPRRQTERSTVTSTLTKQATLYTTKLLLLLLLPLSPYATKEPKHLEPRAMKLNQSLRSSLLINVCLFSYKGASIYNRPWGRSNNPITLFRFLTNDFTRF